MSVNPFGVQLLPENDEGEELCVICQDSLNKAPTYALPECTHRYHTHCIVTWFRHRPSSEDYCTNDGGRCPLCGNRGINYTTSGTPTLSYRFSRYRGLSGIAEKIRYNCVMSESRKASAPKELIKLIKKQKLSMDGYTEAVCELRKFKKIMKEQPIIYSTAHAKLTKLRRTAWRKRSVAEGCRRAIIWFPIVPIIIPTPIDIN